MIAYADESARRGPNGLYLVAAVVVGPDRAGDVTNSLHQLLLPGQTRIHWRDERRKRRETILERILPLPVRATICWCGGVEPKRQERARALILERLLWDLRDRGIKELVLESRDEALNARDRRTIVQVKKAHGASPDLAYRFARPEEEHLLWLPDIAAGAMASQLAGETDAYQAALGRIVLSSYEISL